MPSDYQLYTQNCIGIQSGSSDSLAICNGVAVYKSSVGIMQMSDSLPVLISAKLGADTYSEAVGGTDGYKYYVSMLHDGERFLYVYDFSTKFWHIQNSPGSVQRLINYKNTVLMAYDEVSSEEDRQKLSEINERIAAAHGIEKALLVTERVIIKAISPYRVSFCVLDNERKDNIELPNINENSAAIIQSEDDFSWSFETGDIGYTSYNAKYTDKITARLCVSPYARCDAEIMYDTDDFFRSAATLRGDGRTKTYSIQIRPQRCDYFRLRFSGTGDVKLISIVRHFAKGSDCNA